MRLPILISHSFNSSTVQLKGTPGKHYQGNVLFQFLYGTIKS